MSITILKPRQRRKLFDALCGSGGTMDGAIAALTERDIDYDAIAVNHWDMAVESHKANFPNVQHFTQDMETVNVRALVDEYLDGYVDYFMLSAACQDFSPAGQGKKRNDQRRNHAHFLVEAITEVPVRRIFFENVPAFQKWGPLCEREGGHTGKCALAWEPPDMLPPAKPSMRCNTRLKGGDAWGEPYLGRSFQGWYNDIVKCGWNFQFWPNVNAADYGAPTDRVRLIGVGQREHGPVFFPAPTHCDPKKIAMRQQTAGNMFPELALKPWRTASEIIRWDHPGRSLFDTKPRRKDGKAKAPNTMARLAQGALDHWGPVGPAVAWAFTDIGLDETSPVAIEALIRLSEMPHTSDGIPILPYVLEQTDGLILGQHGGNVADAASASPTPTITGGGYVTMAQAMVIPWGPKCGVQGVDVPLPVQLTKDRFGLAQGMLMTRLGAIVPNFGERPDQSPRNHSIHAPLPCVTSHGAGGFAQPGFAAADDDSVSRKRLVQTADGQTFKIDVLFRMFMKTELLDAQGASPGYIVLGNQKDQMEQIGNMVSPPVAKAFIGAQEDADARMLVVPQPLRTVTPLPVGRVTALDRQKVRRGAAS